MNARIASRLRALRNAPPTAGAAPTPSGAEGSAAPPMINTPIEVVSGDTPTQDHVGETLPNPSINGSDDPSKAGARACGQCPA
ncbi:UNVERIFIED_CONTAM: hypothetical protein Slati_2503800 [Sesamum latifolium]|uniref:Uncharacterized protein n=1 Tax=Sesamum latifolium TaxID=2727402 RepID=A0AAW2WFP4_9LAMI